MSNVAKLKKKAAEFEQKKQLDKALAIYVQILDEHDGDDDEADVALYNRVGDLLLRQGNVGDAVTYYEKAVDLYAEGGFFNNAIALCNKILRQSPGRNSIYYKLGKISAKKGFNTDAKQNFLEYADRMQKAGQIDEAFRALKEFADLCPDQDDIRLMLAEQLAKKNRKGEAMEQLQSLYDKFESEGRGAEARATVDRMKAIDPDIEPKASVVTRPQKSSDLVFLDVSWDEPPAKKPAARSTVQLRAPVEPPAPPPVATSAPAAAAPVGPPAAKAPDLPYIDDVSLPMLETTERSVAGEAEPDAELPMLVVDGLVRGAEFDTDDGAYGSSLDEDSMAIAGLETTALDDDGVDAGGGLVNLDPPLTGDEFANLRLGTPAALAAVPAPEHDLALPGELPQLDLPRDDDDDSVGGGDLQLIMPDDTDLLGAPSELSASLSDLEPPIARRVADPSRAAASPFEVEHSASASFNMPDLSDLSNLSDLTDLSGADLPMLDIETPATSASESIEMDLLGADGTVTGHDDAIAIEPSTLDFVASASPPGAPPAPLLSEIELDDAAAAVAANAPAPSPAIGGAIEPATLDGIVRLSEENAPPPAILRAAAAAAAAAATGAAATTAAPAGGGVGTVPASATEAPARRRSSTSILAQSVDGLRLRVAANESDWTLRRQLGEALLEGNEREAGLQELEAALIGFERADDLETARSVAEEIIRVNPNSVRHHQKRVEYAFRTSDKSRLVDAYRELADALFRGGQGDKSRAVYQRVLDLAPDDARATAALATLVEPAPPPAARKEKEKGGSTGTYRRYTAEVSKSAIPAPEPEAVGSDDDFVNLGDWLRSDEVPKSTRMVVGEQEPSGDEQADFADMLKKFKQGVAENVEEEDHESHYDLGVAYKEMGLVDEAIAEFQKALRGTEKRVRNYEALGQCFLEKSQFAVAATILQRALAERGHGDEQLVGVLYLLGYCSEALQKWSDAIMYYQRVFSVDIRFRDVAERLTSLERVAR